ncbi:MAG: hypothetical protein WCP26_16520 [Actinomycetes bacterium]
MNVHERLDELGDMITQARSMPMSASCIVNRSEVLDIIEDIRASLPQEIQEADRLLDDREQVLADADTEAERILELARADAAQLITQEWVYAAAIREAELVRREAEDDSNRMRQEIDDYVDAKLAGFEIALNKTLSAVARGRDKLRGTDMSPQVFEETGPMPAVDDGRRDY